jgi:hypothetical protein
MTGRTQTLLSLVPIKRNKSKVSELLMCCLRIALVDIKKFCALMRIILLEAKSTCYRIVTYYLSADRHLQ